MTFKSEGSRGSGAESMIVSATGCEFDPHSRKCNVYLNLYFHFFALKSRLIAALNSATQHAVPRESGGKSRTECLTLGSLCLPRYMRETACS